MVKDVLEQTEERIKYIQVYIKKLLWRCELGR